MNHNITYILLDNDNTAMTGHQVTPRTGQSVEGEVRPRQNMLEVVKSLKVTSAMEVNPSDRYFYKNLLLELVQAPGVKVVVSNKECGLTFHGRKKKAERTIFNSGKTEEVKEFYQINTLACEDCRVCVDMTGCPGLSQTQDAYGTKVIIDPQICVSDSYCTKMKACPSFELVKVHEYHPTKYKLKNTSQVIQDIPLPQPKKNLAVIASGNDFRSIVIGVGGSGVTTISRVLAEASESMGGRHDLDFKFVDQKGLAQRNGSVTSHISIFHKNKSQGQVVALASADLVLSPDLLEGARAVEYLSPEGLLIIDADFQVPLSILLDRGIDHKVMTKEDLQKELVTKLGKRLVMAPMKQLCFEKFQRPVYASAMILGIAFQAGRLPFSLEDLRKAFESTVSKNELAPNWEAFTLGREWFSLHHDKPIQDSHTFYGHSLEPLRQSLMLVGFPWQNSQRFVDMWTSHTSLLKKNFPMIPENYLAQYVHDIIVFDQGLSLNDFYHQSQLLTQKYSEEDLPVALRTLAKTYWIKDEVFVSHLMISPMKKLKDKNQYGDLGSSYEIVHINRPSFNVMNKRIEFDLSPRPWMLHLMKHFRVLRKILPTWHDKEKKISELIRSEIAQGVSRKRLNELESIKGYREVRYKAAEAYLRNSYE
jgi:indolepyruvate ferredoxin oxidoreductase